MTLSTQVQMLIDALVDASEHIQGEVDVIDGDYGFPAPNNAMQLSSTIDTALTSTTDLVAQIAKLERVKGELTIAYMHGFEEGKDSANKWQPIDSAPKNNKDIIAWGDCCQEISIIRWAHYGQYNEPGWFCVADGLVVIETEGDTFKYYKSYTPKYWMPLPNPPTQQKE